MIPRATRPALASARTAGLFAARLALPRVRAAGDDIEGMGLRLPTLQGVIWIFRSYQVPHASVGAGSSGGVRNVGGAVRSSAPRGEVAAASRWVSAGRFHFSSTSFSTEVWSNTSDRTQSGRA